jgi:ABC-type dipeptide/oligopeptide/nickel transport system permease subunit
MEVTVVERPAAVEAMLEPAARLERGINAPLIIGSIGVALFLTVSLGAPFLAPYGPTTIDTLNRLKGASALHYVGTDQFGRDTFSRLLYGGRASLIVAAISVGIGLVGGAVIGMIAGYRSGPLDSVLMRAMDLLFSFPAILLAIVIMAVLGGSLTNAMIAIGVIFIPGFARHARSLTRSVVLEQFVSYGRSTGVPFGRILLRDVLPNVAPGLIVQATVAVGYAVTLEATLNFLGLGAQPPAPSWGNMIDAGRGFMSRAPLMVIAPAGAILFTVLVTNLLGEGLQLRNDERQSRGAL